MKRFDLMHGVNARGTFVCSQACIPHLAKAANPHILNLSPPLNLDPKWFKHHVAYTMAKYGMSLCVLGMAEEFRDDGIAVNALWPRTVIATAALAMLGGADPARALPQARDHGRRRPRHPHPRQPRGHTGNFYIDEEVLRAAGVTDFEQYAVKPGTELFPDFFVD